MELNKKISADYIQAMRDKDDVKKTLLATLKGEMQTLAKNKGVDFLENEDATVILQKSVKNMKQTLSDYEKTGRVDTENILIEISIVESYLPKQLSEEEVKSLIKKFISEGMDNIGAIMGKFRNIDADKKVVSKLANEMLR